MCSDGNIGKVDFLSSEMDEVMDEAERVRLAEGVKACENSGYGAGLG